MKKTAAAASALALGALTTPAHADEPATGHDWTGFYVGAAAGMADADMDWDIDGGEGFFSDEDGSSDANDQVGVGALKAGYNHQIGGLVIGGELDYALTNFEESTRFDGGEGAEMRSKMHGMGSLRGRIGYAMDRVLCFATGGLALGDLKSTYDSDGSPATKKIETLVGWVAGGGVEVAVSENVSLVAEALFATFQDEGTAKGPFYNDKFDVDTDLTMGRLGVNVRF